MEKCCYNCEYRQYDKRNKEYYCDNEESPKYGRETGSHELCDEYEAYQEGNW